MPVLMCRCAPFKGTLRPPLRSPLSAERQLQSLPPSGPCTRLESLHAAGASGSNKEDGGGRGAKAELEASKMWALRKLKLTWRVTTSD